MVRKKSMTVLYYQELFLTKILNAFRVSIEITIWFFSVLLLWIILIDFSSTEPFIPLIYLFRLFYS